MTVLLTTYRHSEPHISKHETIKDAAETALGVLESDAAFPDLITDDGKTIWKFLHLGTMREELARLAGAKEIENK